MLLDDERIEDAYGELGERNVEETGLAGNGASCQLGMTSGVAAGDTHEHEATSSESGLQSIPFGS